MAEKSHFGVANRAFSTHRPDRTIEAIYMYNVSEDDVRLRALELFDTFVNRDHYRLQSSFDNDDYEAIARKFACSFDFNPADN